VLLLGLVGLMACLVVFGFLAEDVRAQEASALDALATTFLHSLASPMLDAAMNGATFLGSDLTLIPVLVVAVVYLISRRHRREAVFVMVALGGSVLANATMKLFFHRARPELAWADVLPDFSFPSGHSMNSMVFYLSLALVVWRLRGARWGMAATVLAVVLAVLIGLSRIYLGYHYLTDVVGGFSAAIIWLAIVVAVFRGQALVFGRPRRATGHPPRPT
jgi:membrane-associated phospholipid phosphatase